MAKNFVPKYDEGDKWYGDYINTAPEKVDEAKEKMVASLLDTVVGLVNAGEFLFTKDAPNGEILVGWKLLVPGELIVPEKKEFIYVDLEEANLVSPSKSMTFGDALEALKDGERVSRSGWNGKGQYVFLAHEADFVTDADLSAYDQLEVEVYDMLVLKTAQDTFQPGWLATQTDMLAEDWYVV